MFVATLQTNEGELRKNIASLELQVALALNTIGESNRAMMRAQQCWRS